MDNDMKIPSREEAEQLLTWANEQNPGMWTDHCRVVARAAETIAKECGLDAHRAYVSGLLHDVGRYAGVRQMYHVYAGYELMNSKGYPLIAEICLTHSFPYQDFGAYSGNENDCTTEESNVISGFIAEASYNDYDRLIQLCDSIGMVEGVCLIEKRIVDVVRRYDFNKFTLRKWDSIFALKSLFDGMCGKSIYDLFYDEVRDITFR